MSVCAAPTCSHQSVDGSSYYIDVDVDVYPDDISPKYEELDLSLLYWIPKLRKCPYKQRVYCWVCQVLNETHFQVINIYSISRQNRLQSYCDASRFLITPVCIFKLLLILITVISL